MLLILLSDCGRHRGNFPQRRTIDLFGCRSPRFTIDSIFRFEPHWIIQTPFPRAPQGRSLLGSIEHCRRALITSTDKLILNAFRSQLYHPYHPFLHHHSRCGRSLLYRWINAVFSLPFRGGLVRVLSKPASILNGKDPLYMVGCLVLHSVPVSLCYFIYAALTHTQTSRNALPSKLIR